MTRWSPGSSHRREPQSGQKAERMDRPLSATASNLDVSLVTRIVPAATRNDMPKVDAD